METSTAGPVAALAAAVSAVLDADLNRLSDEEITDALRVVERANRRMAAATTRLIQQSEERSIPRRAGCNSTAAYLQDVLRLS